MTHFLSGKHARSDPGGVLYVFSRMSYGATGNEFSTLAMPLKKHSCCFKPTKRSAFGKIYSWLRLGALLEQKALMGKIKGCAGIGF